MAPHAAFVRKWTVKFGTLPHQDTTRAGEVSRSLVLRNAGVDLVAPGENATLHVADMLKAGLPEDTAGLRASHSALAVDHDVGFLIELVQMLGHGRQRDQLCAGNVRNPV